MKCVLGLKYKKSVSGTWDKTGLLYKNTVKPAAEAWCETLFPASLICSSPQMYK